MSKVSAKQLPGRNRGVSPKTANNDEVRIPTVSPSMSVPEFDFPETLYGVVKRVRVFSEWMEDLRAGRGGRRLSILDFGCGTGTLVTTPLGYAGDQVHGVDPHEASIARARETSARANVTFGSESPADLRAAGACYDVIICSEVLEHLRNPQDVLQDFHMLLAPQGELFVTVPNGYGPFENLCRLEAVLRRLGVSYLLDAMLWLPRALAWRLSGRGMPPLPGRPRPTEEIGGYLNVESGHVQFFALTDLHEVFAATGFEVVSQRGLMFACGPYVDFWARRFSLGGRAYTLNNCLGDRLPLSWVSDWMFRLRKSARQ